LFAVRYAETGEIGLEPVPGGFRTPVLHGGLIACTFGGGESRRAGRPGSAL